MPTSPSFQSTYLPVGRARFRSGVRFFFVVAALLLVAGCSTRFLYDQLDWLIIWKVEDFVELNKEQKQALRIDLHERLKTARQKDLPHMAKLISATARELEGGTVTAAMIDDRYAQMLGEFDGFMLSIVPLSTRLLMSLEPKQIEELFENLDELNTEMYDDYSGRTPEVREKNRNKSAVKSIQNYTGRLSDEQKQIVHEALAEMEDASEKWIDYQRDWQRMFRDLLESRPPVQEYQQRLTKLMVQPRDLHTAEYKARVDSNRRILNDMLAELLTGLSDKQRARAVRKLDGHSEMLNKLAEVN